MGTLAHYARCKSLPEQQFNISTYPLSSEGGFFMLKNNLKFLRLGG